MTQLNNNSEQILLIAKKQKEIIDIGNKPQGPVLLKFCILMDCVTLIIYLFWLRLNDLYWA